MKSPKPLNASIPNTTELMQAFLQSAERRGLSKNTIRWYKGILEPFAKQYPELPLEPEPLESFIAGYTTGDERRHGVFRVLRAFYAFLAERHDIVNPILKVKPPKVKPKEKYALSLDELKVLLEYSGRTPMIKALLHLLADTGIRLGEVVGLTGQDIREDCIKVDGKTGERIIPISQAVREMLLNIMPPSIAKDQRLFPHTTWWLGRLVSKTFKSVGLPGTAHTLRHTFVSHFAGSTQSIMTITGHKSFQMVERYSHRKLEKAKEEHRQSGPLARLYGCQKPTQTDRPGIDSLVIKLATELATLKEKVNQLQAKAIMQSDGQLPLRLDSPGRYQIVQIMPANGFKAVFAIGDDLAMDFERVRLACWGLIDIVFELPDHSTDIAREVAGFIPTNDGMIERVPDMHGFLGYEAPGVEEDDRFIEIYEQMEEVK